MIEGMGQESDTGERTLLRLTSTWWSTSLNDAVSRCNSLRDLELSLIFSVVCNTLLCFSEGYLKHEFEGQKTDHNAKNLKRFQNI